MQDENAIYNEIIEALPVPVRIEWMDAVDVLVICEDYDERAAVEKFVREWLWDE